MENLFGKYILEKREKLRQEDRRYSLRHVAFRIGIEPSYLSKNERGDPAPLSEEKILALAGELNEDSDVLLALSGRINRRRRR